MIGADEKACKRHVGRPPIIIKEVEDMVINIRNSNATDINVYVSDILKATTDTHLTKYLSQVQLLSSVPNNIDISNISDENIQRVTFQLNDTTDARLEDFKNLHTTATVCKDAQTLELNNINDIIKYIDYNIKNLELYEPLNKLKIALIEMLRQRCN